MNLFFSELVSAPTHLPVTVDSAQAALAAAVTEEIERAVLWRAIVRQERRIVIDGALPALLEFEPATAITSLTRWTPTDSAEVIDPSIYSPVSRDPKGANVFTAPGKSWPEPEREIGSFALTYLAGWEVTDTANSVPASVQHMISKAIAFRAGSGMGDIAIGSLTMSVADSYSTDALPSAITNIGRSWAYRPGIISARP